MSEQDLDLDYFKMKLVNLRQELQLVDEQGGDSTQRVELDQSKVGRLSRMDALQVQAMSVESSRRRTIQIQRIDGALQRMEKGNYGVCLQCEEAIALKRLEFDPTAFTCIGCANRKG